MIPALPCLFLFVLLNRSFAGDAVVIGYNADGVWTAVTYYASSTPKGGDDYREMADARNAALRDLKKRAGGQMVRSEVLSESDSTGYVAVARGKTERSADVTVVGRGSSQSGADEEAFAQLNQAGAAAHQKVVYRFFSFGLESYQKRQPDRAN